MDNKTLNLLIGDIQVIANFDHAKWLEQTKIRYANFIIGQTKYIAYKHLLRITAKSTSTLNRLQLNPNADVPNVVFDKNKKNYSILWHSFYGEFSLMENQGEVLCTNFPGDFQSFLRFVYSIVLLQKQDFLIHAASISKNGKGYLFPGKSGAGKSTIARLSSDAILLTDEISLIKKMNDKFYLFGTPFWGELAVGGENNQIPLSAIYFPKKDKEVFRKTISPSQSLVSLLPNVVSWLSDFDSTRQLFNACWDFARNIPSYELHFLPNPSFWNIID